MWESSARIGKALRKLRQQFLALSDKRVLLAFFCLNQFYKNRNSAKEQYRTDASERSERREPQANQGCSVWESSARIGKALRKLRQQFLALSDKRVLLAFSCLNHFYKNRNSAKEQ